MMRWKLNNSKDLKGRTSLQLNEFPWDEVLVDEAPVHCNIGETRIFI